VSAARNFDPRFTALLDEAERVAPKRLALHESGVHVAVRVAHVAIVATSATCATPLARPRNLSSETAPVGRLRNEVSARARLVGSRMFDAAMRASTVSNADLAAAWNCDEKHARERRIGDRPLELGHVIVVFHRLPQCRVELRRYLELALCLGEERS
jgi:hypothetical protein